MAEKKRSDLERLTDEALMLRYQQGEDKAFDCLFARYRNLKGYAARRIGNAQIAENVVQDVWVSVIKARDRYEPKSKFKTYLFKILENKIIDNFRAQDRTHKLFADDTEDKETQLEQFSTKFNVEDKNFLQECIQFLQRGISMLPDNQNQCLQLRYETNMSYEELADYFGVGRETIKSRLRYARNKLIQVVPEECLEGLI